MSGTRRKVLIAFDGDFLKGIDLIAKREGRNRSDLVREATRQYLWSQKDRESFFPKQESPKTEVQDMTKPGPLKIISTPDTEPEDQEKSHADWSGQAIKKQVKLYE